jgi:dTDP-glucose pyrophosphorylase
MVAWALESLTGISYSEVIFVVLAEHEERFGVTKLLRGMVSGPMKMVQLDDVTEGQLCTALSARDEINTDEDLLIASSDTYVLSDLGLDIVRRKDRTRGIISVAPMPGDRWSFARVDDTGMVVEVAEKRRISEHASTGLYYFASGSEFLSIADEIVANKERTNGEYYVIPVYQKYIDTGRSVRISVAGEMWDMGTPEALEHFLSQNANREPGVPKC